VNPDLTFGLFGLPEPGLAEIPAGAAQMSPQVPGAYELEDLPPASLAGMVMAAPPGTVERRYAMALSVRALRPGASFAAMAPKTKGGSRIAKELESFGCEVESSSRRHHRICRAERPAMFDEEAQACIDEAIDAGGPRFVDALGLWSQPGIFSWDRLDAGTALLLSVLPSFAGRGADFGCGIGVIARAVLASTAVTQVDLVDIDRRAIAAARKNIADPRATFHWADVRRCVELKNLDFVAMNPPFHDGGLEDKALGESFVRQSHHVLRDGGTAWLVANVHLPYESVMAATFSNVALHAERNGFKVYEARK
jgi:16S rRNA (guanine1207-N2)-methyltransferase